MENIASGQTKTVSFALRRYRFEQKFPVQVHSDIRIDLRRKRCLEWKVQPMPGSAGYSAQTHHLLGHSHWIIYAWLLSKQWLVHLRRFSFDPSAVEGDFLQKLQDSKCWGTEYQRAGLWVLEVPLWSKVQQLDGDIRRVQCFSGREGSMLHHLQPAYSRTARLLHPKSNQHNE